LSALSTLARWIDTFNDLIGRATAWTALAMVLIQFTVVVMRYIFGVGSIMMQESVIYLHAVLFMVGAGYTLLHGGHVRVDVFYRDASEKIKAWVDFIGVWIFLIPVCILISIYSWPYIRISWKVLEGSKETSGIQGVFLLKSVILVFAILVALQGIAMAARSILHLAGIRVAEPEEDKPLA